MEPPFLFKGKGSVEEIFVLTAGERLGRVFGELGCKVTLAVSGEVTREERTDSACKSRTPPPDWSAICDPTGQNREEHPSPGVQKEKEKRATNNAAARSKHASRERTTGLCTCSKWCVSFLQRTTREYSACDLPSYPQKMMN